MLSIETREEGGREGTMVMDTVYGWTTLYGKSMTGVSDRSEEEDEQRKKGQQRGEKSRGNDGREPDDGRRQRD